MGLARSRLTARAQQASSTPAATNTWQARLGSQPQIPQLGSRGLASELRLQRVALWTEADGPTTGGAAGLGDSGGPTGSSSRQRRGVRSTSIGGRGRQAGLVLAEQRVQLRPEPMGKPMGIAELPGEGHRSPSLQTPSRTSAPWRLRCPSLWRWRNPPPSLLRMLFGLANRETDYLVRLAAARADPATPATSARSWTSTSRTSAEPAGTPRAT